MNYIGFQENPHCIRRLTDFPIRDPYGAVGMTGGMGGNSGGQYETSFNDSLSSCPSARKAIEETLSKRRDLMDKGCWLHYE